MDQEGSCLHIVHNRRETKHIICQHTISHYLSQTLTTVTTEYKVKSLESLVGVIFEILKTYVISFFCFLIERGSSKCMKGIIFPHSFGTVGGT